MSPYIPLLTRNAAECWWEPDEDEQPYPFFGTCGYWPHGSEGSPNTNRLRHTWYAGSSEMT